MSSFGILFRATLKRFRAKWEPVRVKKMRQNRNPKAFSSEVGTGSREENASKQKIRASVLIQSEPRLRAQVPPQRQSADSRCGRSVQGLQVLERTRKLWKYKCDRYHGAVEPVRGNLEGAIVRSQALALQGAMRRNGLPGHLRRFRDDCAVPQIRGVGRKISAIGRHTVLASPKPKWPRRD
jgi:hypothetical protein